jgi:hypothetical protein
MSLHPKTKFSFMLKTKFLMSIFGPFLAEFLSLDACHHFSAHCSRLTLFSGKLLKLSSTIERIRAQQQKLIFLLHPPPPPLSCSAVCAVLWLSVHPLKHRPQYSYTGHARNSLIYKPYPKVLNPGLI